MNKGKKTTGQPISELAKLRKRIAELEKGEAEYKLKEQTLRKSKELFEKTFVSQLDALFILDANDPPKIMDCNPSTTRVFGYSRKEMLGRTTDFLHVDRRSRCKFQDHLHPEIAKHGFFHLSEFEMKRNDGTVFPTEHTVVPLEDDQGKRIGWVSTIRDISERKRAEQNLEKAHSELESRVEERTAELLRANKELKREIAEREQAEAALQQTEEHFRAIFETAEDSIFIKDSSLKYTQVNPAMEKLFDLPASKLIGRTDEDLFGEEAASHIRKVDTRVVGGEIVEEEHTKPVKGAAKSFHVIKVPLRDSSDEIVGLCGIARDITERKQAEDELKTSEKRYRAIVEDQTELICRFSPDATLTFVNEAYCRYFGKTKKELLGFNFFDLIPAADQQAVREHFSSLSPEKPLVTYEHRVIVPPGENRWQHWTDRAIFDELDRLVEYQSVGHDITDLKLTEEKLRRRDAILVALAGSTRRCLEVTSLDEAMRGILQELGRATEVSRVYVFENHVGDNGTPLTSQRHEWVAPGISTQTHNPDTQNFPWFEGGMGRWAEILGNGQAVRGLVKDFPPSEQEILAPQGILSIVAVPIFVEHDWWGFIGFDECSVEREWSAAETEALKAAAATLGAVIQKKKTEEALRRSEEFNRIIIENIADRVFAKDTEGRYTLLTKVSYDFWDIPYGSALGKTDFDIHDPLTAEVFTASDQLVFKTGETYFGEERVKAKDGRGLVVSVTKTPLKDATGKTAGLVGVSRDITAMKKAEEALLQAHEELESRVEERTAELIKLNEKLEREIEERKQAERALRKREAELKSQASELGEVNSALRVLLKQREKDKTELEEKVLDNVKELVVPYVERLKSSGLNAGQTTCVSILESNLHDIVSSFAHNLSSKYLGLTPTEIQIANLVKQGMTSKEIAEIMHSAHRTVEFHRKNIRKKMGIVNRKVNLRSHLLSV